MASAHRSNAPLSVVAAQIVQTALRPDVTLEALLELAVADPGFAARVLSMVNSAAYGLSHRVTDVRQACARLGERGLRNLALGLVVSDMVPTGDAGKVLIAISVRRAVAARLIAAALREKMIDDAFSAGMFLEVGLLSRAREDLEGAAHVARMPAAHRCVVDRAFGFDDHAAQGAKIAAEIGLSETVIEAVKRHHDPSPPAEPIARIAWAAERVAAVWEGGDVAHVKSDALQALARIGVPTPAAADLMGRIPEQVTAIAGAFERTVAEQLPIEQLAADAHAQLVELNNSYAQLIRRLESLLAEKDALTVELQRANSELASLAATDPLTGLPNKRAFTEALARELAQTDRQGHALSLVMVDIDHFKRINDTLGHPAGDLVLTRVGQVLASVLRASDMVARYGGEEFVVLLPCTEGAGAMVLGERLRAALEGAKIDGPQGPIKVTASFGVASVKGKGCKSAAGPLLERADGALYAAKNAGRNRVMLAR